MRLIFTISLISVLLKLNVARARQGTDISRRSVISQSVINQANLTQTQKSQDDDMHITRPHILSQTGLDGKIYKINTEPGWDKAGIFAYGVKKYPLDNGITERVQVIKNRFYDLPTSRNRILMRLGKLPKRPPVNNGVIERISLTNIIPQRALEDNAIRVKRSIQNTSINKGGKEIVVEANGVENMEAQEAKVFRPLFVYKHQVAARRSRKHLKNLSRNNYRRASHPFWNYPHTI